MRLPISDLQDRHGRGYNYLRLSITDVCNYSCGYCLPDGYQKTCKSTPLSLEEIILLAEVFVSLGIKKIRITGGEPVVRSDFVDIISHLSDIKGLDEIALTTNGYKLAEHLPCILSSNLKKINISIDSLNPHKFYEITKHDRLQETLAAIEELRRLSNIKIKINAVLLKGINDDEIDGYIAWAKQSNISIRFIELMRTEDNINYFHKHHLSSDFIEQKLIASGWQRTKRSITAGPAKEFSHVDYAGNMGIIAPYSQDFCTSCNRLRISAQGDLHLCLFNKADAVCSLRPYLKSQDREALVDTILNHLPKKLASHSLAQEDSGVRLHLASIGG